MIYKKHFVLIDIFVIVVNVFNCSLAYKWSPLSGTMSVLKASYSAAISLVISVTLGSHYRIL